MEVDPAEGKADSADNGARVGVIEGLEEGFNVES